MSWIDNALSTSAQALVISSRRAELLATNLANANTPGYKARDIDFRSIMSDQQTRMAGVSTTRAGHIGTGFAESFESYERQSTEQVENGNTVSKEKEQAAYTQNSVRYMASLRFLNGSVQGILKALRGE